MGAPFLLPGHGSPQGFLSPHTEPLSCSGTSSLQPVCPVRPQVQSAGRRGPSFPQPRAAGRRAVTKARSYSIRKVWKPLSFLHPLPPVTRLGAGAGRPQGGPGLGLWVCFDWSVICCPLVDLMFRNRACLLQIHPCRPRHIHPLTLGTHTLGGVTRAHVPCRWDFGSQPRSDLWMLNLGFQDQAPGLAGP